MRATTEPLFHLFDIPTGPNGLIQYYFDEEDSRYHGIGQIENENYGVDPTKKQVYRNIGAQQKLLSGEADIVFIWDPDGDRFNMISTASEKRASDYVKQGLMVDEDSPEIVYFTPNQIFFMLIAHRLDNLISDGALQKHDWFLASSVTTTRALDELAAAHGIPVLHVKVGFKWWGMFADWLEQRKDPEKAVPFDKIALKDSVHIGANPRMLIMNTAMTKPVTSPAALRVCSSRLPP